MTEQLDPLADDDVFVEIGSSFFARGYTATATHKPTGLVGEGTGASQTSAIAEARDALLKLLEEAGGC